MEDYSSLAESVRFNDDDSVLKAASECLLIGVGRSAAVFKIKDQDKVMKVFFPDHEKTAEEEAEIYHLLAGSEFYPSVYDSGENYLVIDYVEGKTFFQCLSEGIVIEKKHIDEVDEALGVARNRGLKPSDVHLRNIMLKPDGHIMMIDLARFRQEKVYERQWEDLKRVWKYYHKSYFPKKMPAAVLNGAAFLYKKGWERVIAKMQT
ncbi:protein kinase family protein [Jeotgalibacillus haloalkalitolerans]|uniref:Protein kinase family protein n=1 Tax=Jeotgalibacillus haloalkalitolerans TaxID=3104292 RepID=A0ABU5KNM4_9BACL|nr:protein kinase family protein [Jeotgalibacillus sp. HH7-29]MDZ5712863.1 protein kinase family protein [Jeotgalibacillus sp. HH7-29]